MNIILKVYIFLFLNTYTVSIFADNWIIWDANWSCWEMDLRTWEVHTCHIPQIIVNMTDFFMWIAWTVSIIFIIIWGYQILFWSLENDKTKWKNTIVMALAWFAIASLSWVIIKLILDNFS